MGNKDEKTNLIGRKGSKMTMQSNVKTLALKVYDEQIPGGWEKLKERIKELKKAKYQCLGIKHDEDVLGDDFFEPSTEKPHYHILIRVMQDAQNVTKSGKHVSTILNDLGIVFRKEDATMIANHGIETVGDFGAYATYLTHDTEKAINDGKQHYDMSAIVSNMSSEEILKIREGYVRVSDKMKKVTSGEIVEVDEFCYELGRQFGDFDDWYYNQRIFLRSNARMKHCKEKYNKGIQDSIDAESFINRLCIFITGKGNTGKSYTSKMTLIEMGYKRIVSVDNCGTGKFDKVTPTTQAIIINDQTAPALLNLCDNAPTLVYHRGSGDQYFTGNIVIVTSNLSFEEWAKECGQSLKQIQPLKSRFYICEIAENNLLVQSGNSDRGIDDQQGDKYIKFLEFQELYNKLILNYKKTDSLKRFYKMNEGNCDPKKTHEILNELRCHKVCSKTFEVKSNTVRLKRDKKKIQKRFLHTPEQTLEEKAKNWKWTPGK